MTDEIAVFVCFHTSCLGIKRRSALTFIVFLVFFLGVGRGGADERAQHVSAGGAGPEEERAPPTGVHRYDANTNITSIKAVFLHCELVPGRFLVEDMDNLSFQVYSCWICCPDSGTHSSVISSLHGSLTSDLTVRLQGDRGRAPQHPV